MKLVIMTVESMMHDISLGILPLVKKYHDFYGIRRL